MSIEIDKKFLHILPVCGKASKIETKTEIHVLGRVFLGSGWYAATDAAALAIVHEGDIGEITFSRGDIPTDENEVTVGMARAAEKFGYPRLQYPDRASRKCPDIGSIVSAHNRAVSPGRYLLASTKDLYTLLRGMSYWDGGVTFSATGDGVSLRFCRLDTKQSAIVGGHGVGVVAEHVAGSPPETTTLSVSRLANVLRALRCEDGKWPEVAEICVPSEPAYPVKITASPRNNGASSSGPQVTCYLVQDR